jgi:hypothetical protein
VYLTADPAKSFEPPMLPVHVRPGSGADPGNIVRGFCAGAMGRPRFGGAPEREPDGWTLEQVSDAR